MPIRLVQEAFSLPVGIVNPNTDPNEPAIVDLANAARFVRQLRASALVACQFFDPVIDGNGNPITKPPLGSTADI
jgi:hypothetical protein